MLPQFISFNSKIWQFLNELRPIMKLELIHSQLSKAMFHIKYEHIDDYQIFSKISSIQYEFQYSLDIISSFYQIINLQRNLHNIL